MNKLEFAELARVRLEARGYSNRTVKAYLMWTNRLADFYPGKEIGQLTDEQIEVFLEFLLKRRRLSISTVAQALHAFTAVFSATVSRDLDLNTARQWRKGEAPEIFTPDEVLALFDSTDNETYELIFKLIYGAGLKLSEALSLRVEDVVVDGPYLHVTKRGKANRERVAVLPSSIIEDLKPFLSSRNPKEPVWQGSTSEGTLSSSAVQKAFKRALRRTGNPKPLTIRSLRYSYIKHLEAHGVPLWSILSELGMSSSRTLDMMSKVGVEDSSVDISPLDLLSDQASNPSADQRESMHWSGMHPAVADVAKSRFESGHLADSVEAALKSVEARVRDLTVNTAAEKLRGSKLMQRALSPNAPVLQLADLTTESGRNVQIGYMQIFAGSMTGIRNPKAHDNLQISTGEAAHLLYLASLLMYKLDEACTNASNKAV